ncbi:MAG: hypothetical protein ABJC36_01425 [Gemmatimonadales bacterium]
MRVADGSPPELVTSADQKHQIRTKAIDLGIPVAHEVLRAYGELQIGCRRGPR